AGLSALIVGKQFVRTVEVLTERGLIKSETVLCIDGDTPEVADYSSALAEMPSGPLSCQPTGATMLFSSGTTGRPKAVRPNLPDCELAESRDYLAETFGRRYGFGPATRFMTPAPLYHSAPLRFCAAVLRTGGTVLISDGFR